MKLVIDMQKLGISLNFPSVLGNPIIVCWVIVAMLLHGTFWQDTWIIDIEKYMVYNSKIEQNKLIH